MNVDEHYCDPTLAAIFFLICSLFFALLADSNDSFTINRERWLIRQEETMASEGSSSGSLIFALYRSQSLGLTFVQFLFFILMIQVLWSWMMIFTYIVALFLWLRFLNTALEFFRLGGTTSSLMEIILALQLGPSSIICRISSVYTSFISKEKKSIDFHLFRIRMLFF